MDNNSDRNQLIKSKHQGISGLITQKRVFLALTICVVIAVVVTIVVVVLRRPSKSVEPIPTPVPFLDQFECVASQEDKDVCTKAGCEWQPSLDPDTPSCLLPKNASFGFHSFEYDTDIERLKLRVAKGSFFGDDFKNATVKVIDGGENVVRIQFLDEGTQRYQVPVDLNFESRFTPLEKQAYEVELERNPEKLFSFKVLRSKDKKVIFDSSVSSLFLAEHHIEVTTRLPSMNVYGIGESTHKTFRHDLSSFNKWPLFSRDQEPNPWNGAGRYNLYGVHPYYMCLEDSGKAHGVLFLNSNAMEFTLTPMPALNFRTSGGVLDMIFFLGDSPEHVTQLYTEVIGRPMIPPYWGLGFQLSRYGYNTLENMRTAIDRTRANGFPLDVIHADIDLMEERKDFTWDKKTFPNFDDFIRNEKKLNGLRFITIVDPAIIANDSKYAPYQEGLEADVFIKWPESIPHASRNNPPYPGIALDKDIMFGQVWPNGPVAFPDFFRNATKTWWTRIISDYRNVVDFDGLWIDMNEPSNFGTNQDEPWFCPSYDKKCWALKCPENDYDNPKNTFVPAATSIYTPNLNLADKTICMAAIQGENREYVHYDVHSLYGWSEIEPTYQALKYSAKPDQAPLVISRSTYPSSGRHSGHWLGDNLSTWNSMRSSIVGMLEFNLFGIPYIGADICGFSQNSTSELCGRWMQLGAFYPFCRNHNMIGAIDQDPGSPLLSDKDRKRARTAMVTRYQLLPYLHTLHYLAHTNGNTVVRALFHEFPTDKNTYDNQEQFMWGSSLLISPVLYEGVTTIDVYLPDSIWYDFYEGKIVSPASSDRKIQVSNLEIVSLHVKAGSILPLKLQGAKTTNESRDLEFEIRVYPENGTAKGDLFWTAKEAVDFEVTNTFRVFHFELSQTKLVIQLTSNDNFTHPNKQVIGKTVLYGQPKELSNVKYQGQDLDSKEFSYDSGAQIFTIAHKIDLEELQSASENDRTRILEWT